MTSVNSVYYNLFYFYNNFVCSFFVEFLFNKFFLVKKEIPDMEDNLNYVHITAYLKENSLLISARK